MDAPGAPPSPCGGEEASSFRKKICKSEGLSCTGSDSQVCGNPQAFFFSPYFYFLLVLFSVSQLNTWGRARKGTSGTACGCLAGS